MFNRKTFDCKTFNRKTFHRTMLKPGTAGCSLRAKLALGALFAALCLLPACSITTGEKGKNGEKNVDIKTPVGDLHVGEQADTRDAGLTLYPGAKPAPKEGNDDKKSANVNLSLPGFSLKVVAAEYVSDDAPDKIIAYYDNELKKYGKPIQCHGGWDAHLNAHINNKDTDESSKPVSCGNEGSSDAVELKVGTEGTSISFPSNPAAKVLASLWFMCACARARTTRFESKALTSLTLRH